MDHQDARRLAFREDLRAAIRVAGVAGVPVRAIEEDMAEIARYTTGLVRSVTRAQAEIGSDDEAASGPVSAQAELARHPYYDLVAYYGLPQDRT